MNNLSNNVQAGTSIYPAATMKVVIVDDERKACTNLQNLIKEYISGEVQIAGVANSTIEAEKLINQENPNVVFLDIEMPGENGMHFLDRISPFNFEVVFVTAYDEYAVKAFKFNAVDYLLKPISIDELIATFQKLNNRLAYREIIKSQTSYADLYKKSKSRERFDKITLRGQNTTELVDVRDILYVEALSSYCKIYYFRNKTVKDITMSCPSSDLEEVVPEQLFFRIHKSYLLNCMFVKKIINNEGNFVVLATGSTLPVSRRRYTLLIDFLKSNNYYTG